MPSRRRVRLVHWKQEEVPERATRLEAAGYEVDGEVPGTSIGVAALRQDPPDAFVIDLGRLPSHGREVAFSLRQSKALRGIPIVFVGGAEATLGPLQAGVTLRRGNRGAREDVIRAVALPAGMVDTKVCAIDETWSGLRLSMRRSQLPMGER